MSARSILRAVMAIPVVEANTQLRHKRYNSEAEIQVTQQRPQYSRSISLPELSSSVILDRPPFFDSCEVLTPTPTKFKDETVMAIPVVEANTQLRHKRYNSETEIQVTQQRPEYSRSISLPELSSSVILDRPPFFDSCEVLTPTPTNFKGETTSEKTIKRSVGQKISSQQIFTSDQDLSTSSLTHSTYKIRGNTDNEKAAKPSGCEKPCTCRHTNTKKLGFKKHSEKPSKEQTPWKHQRRTKRESQHFNFLSVFVICFFILSSTLHLRSPTKDRQYHINYIPIDYKSRKKVKNFKRKDSSYCSNDPTFTKLKHELLKFLLALSGSMFNWQKYAIVLPFNSLNTFFKGVENGVSFDDSMNYEWVRLRSFSSFRHGSVVSPIILSRWGFFYTGMDSEVKCFSCGVRYNQWSSGDNVFEIHRRISLNCRHLTGNDQRNVPIGHRNSVSLNHQSGASLISETSQHSEQHYNNRHQSGLLNTRYTAYTSNVPSEANFERQQARLPQMDNINVNESRIRNVSNTEQRTTTQQFEYGSTNRESRNTSTSYTASPIRTQQSNINGVSSATINKLSPLGVNFDKPRYPQYAVLSIRMSTYNGWPGTQIPRKMAEAGFIYAGYADYTRCFFCGGGLRNWEHEDDPWIEHARWFPRCAYVRQNKGDQFVQLVHERLEEMVRSTAEENTTAAPRNEELPTQKIPEYQEVTQLTTTANNTRSHESNLKSLPCYQSVLELGYASDMIEQIIHQLIEKGLKDFTSADILEVIFKMEEEGSSCHETAAQESQVEEAASLIEENRRLREQRLCMICVEKDSCIAFLPCGHLVCCEECAPAMKKCPKCQQIVQGSIKTWLV